MHIKTDEDLPRAIISVLEAHGYAAQGVYDQGMSGWPDERLFTAVQAEGRFLITADKGFGDLRHYPPGEHAGILILRPGRPSISAFVGLLERLLERHRLEEFQRCLVIVTPQGIRVRRPE